METTDRTWLQVVQRHLTLADSSTRASDGLVSFSVMWAVALIFSVMSHYSNLTVVNGYKIALIQYAVIGICVAVILQPRRLSLLLLLAGAMAVQYVYRLPVASNNQTIAFFMNAAIITVVGMAWLRGGSTASIRTDVYEQLRIVARLLLAIMYFYGIFHKINHDFLDPDSSCAVALYRPLVHNFGIADNIVGRYSSIAATFVTETVTIVCLFWRRYFAVGLILGLVFHFIIPISAFSWYMDFSSLVFALYVLSVPREVSIAFYARSAAMLRRLPSASAGAVAVMGLAGALLAALLLANTLRGRLGPANVSDMMVWHSSWILIWAIVGGVMMVVLTWAALEALPYREMVSPRQPAWIYLFPAVLFLSCLSPYFGLKTESSIAMFSNLHTEGGTTNHLLLTRPPYIASYQDEVAIIEGSSERSMQTMAERRLGVVRYQLEKWMRAHPGDWATFTIDGQRYEHATAQTFPMHDYNLLERRLLIFKPVDYARPKQCTH